MDARTPPIPITEGPFALGSFWPGSTEGLDRDYEAFDDFLMLAVRHLPTRAALARARARFGTAADTALDGWVSAWRGAVGDVDAHARAIEYVEPWDRQSDRAALCEDRIATLSTDGRRGEAARLLASLHAAPATGPVRDPAFHVVEDAATLVALLEGGVPLRLALTRNGVDEPVFYECDGDGPVLIGPDGPRHAETLVRWDLLMRMQNPNWLSAAFASLAGRGAALCRGWPILVATLLDMALQGHGRAFLKHAVHKRGTWVVDLDGVGDYPSACARLAEALGPAIADLASGEHPRDGMVVQAFVPFRAEHRFFVVGHRVVASTASDRDLSVLDARRGRILGHGVARLRAPPGGQGRYDRGGSDLTENRTIQAAMALGARELALALRDEGVFPPHYVIDMGEAGGTVLPIEVNTFANAGRYGVDCARVARSLARWYAEPARHAAYARRRRLGEEHQWLPFLAGSRGLRMVLNAVGALSRVNAAGRGGDTMASLDEAQAREITMAWFATLSKPGPGKAR